MPHFCTTIEVMKLRYPIAVVLFLVQGLVYAQEGLKGEYFNGRNFESKAFSRTDRDIDFNWDGTSPGRNMGLTDYSIRWTGKLLAPETGVYTFSATVDDGIRVWVGGVKLIDAWGPHDHENISGDIKLTSGQSYDLKIEYFNGILEGQIKLFWIVPSDQKEGLTSWFSKGKKIDARYFRQPVSVVPVAIPDPKPQEEVVVSIKPQPKPEPIKVVVPPIQAPKTAAPPPSAVAAPAPPTRSARMRDTILKYTPKNILFDPGQPFILEESYPELDRLVKLLTRFENLKIQIDGHTDITGDKEINLQLSKDRASEVAWYLKDRGIAATRIKTRGFGATKPLFSKDSTKMYPQNRRVEFKIE